MTRSKNDNVIAKLNLHQSAFSADFFNGDSQIRETSLQTSVETMPIVTQNEKENICILLQFFFSIDI